MMDVKQSQEDVLGNDNFDNSFSIRDILSKYIYHWPVFILVLILSFSVAFVYLRYTKPIYQATATLLIKDDKKGASSDDALAQLDLFNDSKVVENEIEILQSKTLMQKVVNRLHLDVSYQDEGRVISFEMYGKVPVKFVTVDMNASCYGKELQLSITDSVHYTLIDIESGKKAKGNINELQRNIFGTYKIELTSSFSKSKNTVALVVKDPRQVTNQCLSHLTVAIKEKQSTVLELGYQTEVPLKGVDILNTLIQVYNEASLEDKNKTTQSTIHFINDRLKLITGELTDVEKDVENFKSSNGIIDISSTSEVFLDNVKTNDAQLNEVNIKLGVVKDIEKYINSNSTQEKLPSTMGIEDPVLLGQITQLSDLQLQREKLLATTQSNNPMIEPITRQIETVRAGIRANVQNIKSSILTTQSALNANNDQFQGMIKKVPEKERQFTSIKRQQTIKETLYLYLLQKKEEAALSYASSVADSRVVDPAFYNKDPISPKRQIVYLIALLSGFLLPVAYVYGKDLLNNKVESRNDVKKLTSVPILGELIFQEDTEPIVVQPDSRRAIAEQFRSIRTNLQFVHNNQISGQGNVTLFTSSMSGEGKSYVTNNIGAALAISGRKTILLELDLRKPKISKYLNLPGKNGLSNYLIGKVDIKDIIQPSGIHPNLFVIGSGPVPPNPSELLIRPDVEALIEYLKENYDEIIIDTPPIGLVTDAQILARIADATIYLVRQEVTFKQQLMELDILYKNQKLPRLNIILNGVSPEGSYGYGYYSDDMKQKSVTFKTIIKNIIKRF